MIPYATLNRLKQHRNIPSTNNKDDEFLLWLLQSASAMIEKQTCRHFTPYYANLSADIYHAYDNTRINAPDDILKIETVINGDGALTVAVHDGAWIDNPSGWKYPTLKSKVEIMGIWGYHETPNTMWDTVGTLQEDFDSSTEQISVTNITPYSVGQMLKIDDEFLLVVEIDSSPAMLTVERSMNGSIPSTHQTGAKISIYQQTHGIEMLCVEIAAWLYKNRDRVNEYIQFSEGSVRIGDLSRDISHMIKKYSRCHCYGY